MLRHTRGSKTTPNKRRNSKRCPRCHRFGTFAPSCIVCDRCLGALPLIFITVTVVQNGGEQ